MFCAKIPKYIKDGHIRLRPLSIFDSRFISNGLRYEVILKANRLSKPIDSSWFFVWWWMKKTFTPAYCIECYSRPIGFIGLYNLIPGKSAEMSLIIFYKNKRRLGYGTRVFNLCAQGMQRHSVVKEIIVKVKADNHGALSFWRKLGFVEAGIINGLITMSMGL